MNVSRKVKRWFSFTMVSIFPGTKLELRQESWGPDRIQIFDFTRVPCGWITELRRDSWGQRRGLILCTARISNTELYNFRTYFRCGFCVIGYNRSAHIIFFLDKASCKLLEQYMLYAILAGNSCPVSLHFTYKGLGEWIYHSYLKKLNVMVTITSLQ